MKRLKDKSLVVTSSIVLALLLVLVIGITEYLSYSTQKKSYLAEIERIGETLSYQIEAGHDLLTFGYNEIAAGKDTKNETFDRFKLQLDVMIKNDIVSNAYVYMPDIIERDGKQFLKMMQSNEALTADGLGAGDEYEMTPGFAADVQTALEKGSVVTEPVIDQFGEWVSYLAQVKDPSGKLVGIFGIDIDYKQINDAMKEMLWQSIGIALVLSVIAILIIIYLIRLVLKPLKRLAEVSSLAAKGDLTLAVPVKGGNEIAQVSLAFNEMIASLRQLTSNIRTTSDEVAGSAYNMQQSAEQTSRATEEVTEAIQEVASGSDTQLQSFQECQRAMTEMTIGIQRIAESSSSVSELAADTTALATEGESVINETLQQMQAVETNVVATVSTLHELKQQSDNIGSILALIGDVANQTNLLALNASIEAARAGEHGKGFAVVAHEIRKLAERSKESSEQIGTILHSIGSQTDAAVTSMELSAEAARAGSRVTSHAGESFRSIVASIRDVSSQVQEVSAASEQMSAGSEQIAASLDELEGITASAAGNSQRVAAASEEQLASMQEVASSSEQLRNLAQSLNEAIGKFKT
ncbi:methyl-accepting chemotaxis protein [Paenibacillus endophyticus]|uniref:Methyl-accepting chemotaxis protein n=1 Tax=Paenibacillus endophyticus TaxID=1294268 RepID=A0A7W5C7T3_9BACL|nr:methyl-accepting chemotaxis protein [Paenibacillus endophyticus]MBB3152676.1 methyl-accepting chemotaxis protein [Paenibacillus endophyticus]